MNYKPHKQTLYSVSWQALRVSLLGNWTSAAGAQINIGLLDDYLNSTAIGDRDEKYSRLWRVLNCLNAVRMGYSGQGLTDSEQDELVRAYRDKVSSLYKAHKLGNVRFVIDDDATVRKEWRRLNMSARTAIYVNLSRRRELHANSSHRDELSHFLSLIKE